MQTFGNDTTSVIEGTESKGSRSDRAWDKDELSTYLDSKIHQAIGYLGGDISGERQENHDFYVGEPYGNEKKDQSKIVTREVLESVEWTLPSLLRVFLSGERPVTFNPFGAEDEEAAKQETDYVNHKLNNQCNLYLKCEDWMRDGLISKNSYIKIWWDETEMREYEEYTGLTETQIASMMFEDEWDDFEPQEADTVTIPDELGQPIETKTYDVKFTKVNKEGKLNLWPVPPEEMLVDNDHSELSLDEAAFVCHRTKKTVGDLIAMGYDEDTVMGLNFEEDGDYNDERVNRRTSEDEQPDGDVYEHPLLREVWVHECYCRVDYDNDGYSELRRVVKVNKEILENEECDYVPFVPLTPYRIPHKHIGMGQADLVKDIQLIKSELVRQTITNAYKVNNPRTMVTRNVNLDDLLDDTPGAPIRVKGGGIDGQINVEPIKSVIAESLPVLDMLDGMREARTGVSKITMGLDPNILAKTNTGTLNSAMNSHNQRLERMARFIAETSFKWLFQKAHHLIRKYQNQEEVVRLRGKWVEVNPNEWNKRENMTVQVGLGTGNRDAQRHNIEVILAKQAEAVAAGGMNKLVTTENIYNALAKLVEVSDLKRGDMYFLDPSSDEAKQMAADEAQKEQEPSPEEMIAQAELIKAQTDQAKVENDKMKLQIEAHEKDMKLKLEHQKITDDARHDNETIMLGYAKIGTAKADNSLEAQRIKEEAANEREAMKQQNAKEIEHIKQGYETHRKLADINAQSESNREKEAEARAVKKTKTISGKTSNGGEFSAQITDD